MLCKSGCHRLASRCMIIHSVHNNNSRSLTSTADLSPISIPTGTFSTTLHALLGNELDYLCKCKLQSHTICYKMAFDPHPILNCTWDVVTTCIPVIVFFPLSEMRTLPTGLLYYSTSRASSALLMATVLSYNTDHRLSKRSV